jgi:hypothetical protein
MLVKVAGTLLLYQIPIIKIPMSLSLAIKEAMQLVHIDQSAVLGPYLQILENLHENIEVNRLSKTSREAHLAQPKGSSTHS